MEYITVQLSILVNVSCRPVPAFSPGHANPSFPVQSRLIAHYASLFVALYSQYTYVNEFLPNANIYSITTLSF